MKQLPPEQNPEIPQDFLDQIEKERDRKVDELVQVAESIFASIPELVAVRIKSLRINWGQINLALAGSADPISGEPGQ